MPGTSYAIRNTTFFEARILGVNALTLEGDEPNLGFIETDQTDPAGRWSVQCDGDAIKIGRRDTSGADYTDRFSLPSNGALNLQGSAVKIEMGTGTDKPVIRGAAGGVRIGYQVDGTTLVVGSAGSIVIPVRTVVDNLDATDAQIGNLEGAVYYNRNNTALGIRTTVADATVNVGLAGIIVQRKVPEVAGGGGLYHLKQFTGKWDAEGRRYVDETRCIHCGEFFRVGDTLTLVANALMDKGDGTYDTHSIFGHLHLEQDEVFQALLDRLTQVEKFLEIGAEAPGGLLHAAN